MQVQRVEQVVQRVRAAMPGIIATDADGTLWSGDVGVDAFESMIERRAIRPEAVEALRATALEAGAMDGDDPHVWASAINNACERGAFSESRTYEMMAWLFAGWRSGEVRAFVREALVARGLARRVHREMKEVLDRLEGATVFVVSASPQLVVEEALAIAGISVHATIAALPAMGGDVILARMRDPIPFGPGKVRALRAHLGAEPVAAAFGDNTFDIEMLRSAAVPVVVRPKPRLRERCAEIDGVVELAPETW
jgi:phosphatidylglycerophosphatase C